MKKAVLLWLGVMLMPGMVMAQQWYQDPIATNPNASDREVVPAMSPDKVLLPAFPKPENWQELDLGMTGRNRVFVDTSSIVIGSDEVMRYAMIIKTPGGASNITYEGVRCSAKERMVYAYGQHDGTWYRARTPKWVPISNDEAQPQYRLLAREVLCENASVYRDLLPVLQNLNKLAPRP